MRMLPRSRDTRIRIVLATIIVCLVLFTCSFNLWMGDGWRSRKMSVVKDGVVVQMKVNAPKRQDKLRNIYENVKPNAYRLSRVHSKHSSIENVSRAEVRPPVQHVDQIVNRAPIAREKAHLPVQPTTSSTTSSTTYSTTSTVTSIGSSTTYPPETTVSNPENVPAGRVADWLPNAHVVHKPKGLSRSNTEHLIDKTKENLHRKAVTSNAASDGQKIKSGLPSLDNDIQHVYSVHRRENITLNMQRVPYKRPGNNDNYLADKKNGPVMNQQYLQGAHHLPADSDKHEQSMNRVGINSVQLHPTLIHEHEKAKQDSVQQYLRSGPLRLPGAISDQQYVQRPGNLPMAGDFNVEPFPIPQDGQVHKNGPYFQPHALPHQNMPLQDNGPVYAQPNHIQQFPNTRQDGQIYGNGPNFQPHALPHQNMPLQDNGPAYAQPNHIQQFPNTRQDGQIYGNGPNFQPDALPHQNMPLQDNGPAYAQPNHIQQFPNTRQDGQIYGNGPNFQPHARPHQNMQLQDNGPVYAQPNHIQQFPNTRQDGPIYVNKDLQQHGNVPVAAQPNIQHVPKAAHLHQVNRPAFDNNEDGKESQLHVKRSIDLEPHDKARIGAQHNIEQLPDALHKENDIKAQQPQPRKQQDSHKEDQSNVPAAEQADTQAKVDHRPKTSGDARAHDDNGNVQQPQPKVRRKRKNVEKKGNI